MEGDNALFNYVIGRKQTQIREIEDTIIKLEVEDKVGPLKKKKSQLEKQKEKLQEIFKAKQILVKRLITLKREGPGFPFLKTAKGRSSRYFMEKDFGIQTPTTEFWNFFVNRASKELARVLVRESRKIKNEVVYNIRKGDGKNIYHVGPYEFQLQGKIVDGEGRPIMQPPEIKYKGKMIDNPNAGKESWFDRVIIDHDKKVIYAHDLVRSSDRNFFIQTSDYRAGLKSMFKDLIDKGYQFDETNGVLFKDINTVLKAVDPKVKAYNAEKGKSYNELIIMQR